MYNTHICVSIYIIFIYLYVIYILYTVNRRKDENPLTFQKIRCKSKHRLNTNVYLSNSDQDKRSPLKSTASQNPVLSGNLTMVLH